ncbi:oleate hydratase [Aspergillus awamori]|uniref:Oleate hydratase n=1 Tax=Aspergillus awamori TaxID=105351 RepID=A0A401KYK8_ASPAW|nr:oleate hydratase [Aspergillus awamori]
MPIIQFLQNQRVDFRLRTKVTDIMSHPDGGMDIVSAIRVLHDSSEETITLHPNDIVIVSLGSVTSGSLSGTDRCPPIRETMIAENELDENWSLWLNLGTKYPSLGDPYNFCTQVVESRLETFTVTLKDAEFFERFAVLTRDQPGTGSLVSLKDTNWKIISNSVACKKIPPGDIQVSREEEYASKATEDEFDPISDFEEDEGNGEDEDSIQGMDADEEVETDAEVSSVGRPLCFRRASGQWQ